MTTLKAQKSVHTKTPEEKRIEQFKIENARLRNHIYVKKVRSTSTAEIAFRQSDPIQSQSMG
jgi:hypothetical protein